MALAPEVFSEYATLREWSDFGQPYGIYRA